MRLPDTALLRLAMLAAVIVPVAMLVLSYVMICLTLSHPAPFLLPAHEDGVRTLLNTILYFEHATRELPLDILLGLVIGGAATFALTPADRINRPGLWWGVGLSVAVILGGSLATVGLGSTLDNLSQNHTRPGAALVPGSHWYYHFFSRIALILSALAIGLALRALVIAPTRVRLGPILLGCGLFAAISLWFSGSPGLLSAAWNSVLFQGHQAREIATHALTTLPLSYAACALIARRPHAAPLDGRLFAGALALLALALYLTAHITYGAATRGAMDQGQSSDIRVLIFPHFFEHALGYVLTPFVAAATFAGRGRT